jgi:hypothetical protein
MTSITSYARPPVATSLLAGDEGQVDEGECHGLASSSEASVRESYPRHSDDISAPTG